MAMAKQEDENYWTSSVTKGFDFDSEENQVTWLECHVIEIRTILYHKFTAVTNLNIVQFS